MHCSLLRSPALSALHWKLFDCIVHTPSENLDLNQEKYSHNIQGALKSVIELKLHYTWGKVMI